VQQATPANWCARLELPGSATYTNGAEVFLKSLADQASLPWPEDFPRKAWHPNPRGGN
jgi:hypothetical protein